MTPEVSTAIDAVVFDIGNVLLRFDFSLALRALTARMDASAPVDPAQILVDVDRVKVAYEDGAIDRAAFLRGVFDVLRYRGTEGEFVRAWEDIFEPNAPMITLVEELSARLPLYLLSNTSDIHRDYVFRRYPFFARFTAGIYSFDVCASKPGRRIFEIAIERLQLVPARTLFIDDLLPNIETARAMGFVCHHYHHDRHALLLEQVRSLSIFDASR
jgi:putative hydrolase of the HAD superfamily